MSDELVSRVEALCAKAAAQSLENLIAGTLKSVRHLIEGGDYGAGQLTSSVNRAIKEAIEPFREQILVALEEREQRKFLDRFSQLFEFIERQSS